MEYVTLKKDGDYVGILTLNRPETLHALSTELLQQLNTKINEIISDRSIRVVILTATGEKAFCVGADLKERKQIPENQILRAVEIIGQTVSKIESLPQPVIAVLNGVAFGGGLELALACDIRIAEENTNLGLTETALGIIPGAGGTQRLTRLIGMSKAKELIFTARRISAHEAKNLGLIDYVVSRNDLFIKANLLAAEMTKNGPLALVQAKKAINEGYSLPLENGLQIERTAYSTLIPTFDRLEGLRAFEEKRSPSFIGR